MLCAEGDQAGDRGVVAALDVGAEELAALGEAEGVDGGGCGEDGVGGEVGADCGDLVGEVAEEGGCAVGAGVGVDADVVDEGAGVYFVGEVADGAEAFSFVAWRVLACA